MGQGKEGSRAVKLSLNIPEGLRGREDLGQLEINDEARGIESNKENNGGVCAGRAQKGQA